MKRIVFFILASVLFSVPSLLAQEYYADAKHGIDTRDTWDAIHPGGKCLLNSNYLTIGYSTSAIDHYGGADWQFDLPSGVISKSQVIKIEVEVAGDACDIAVSTSRPPRVTFRKTDYSWADDLFNEDLNTSNTTTKHSTTLASTIKECIVEWSGQLSIVPIIHSEDNYDVKSVTIRIWYNPMPNKVTTPTPTTSSTKQSHTTNISWTNGGAATSYLVYFGTDSSPDSGEYKGEYNSETYILPILDYDAKYYWRVDAKNAYGTTTGTVWDFRTEEEIPIKPSSPTPSTGDTKLSISSNLSWSNGGYATSYDVYFGTDSSPDSGESKGNKTSTSFNPGTLQNNTTYYWRIDAVNSRATTTGTVWSFTTTEALPEKALIVSPSHTSTDQSINSSLSWSNGGGATSYDVYFGTDSSPDSGESMGNQTSTSYNPETLANNMTYYWRIDAVNSAGTTTGTVWSFTTKAVPTAPIKVNNPNPINNSTKQAITSSLTWTNGGGATSYDVYFGTSSSLTVADKKVNQTSTSYNLGTLLTTTTYYWRIDAVNSVGTTEGTVWSFITEEAKPIQAINPSPDNNATNQSLNPSLTWSNGGGATSYDVYFGTSSSLTVYDKKTNQASSSYSPATLALNTTYYWRVDAVNSAGTTAGTVWSFTTTDKLTSYVTSQDSLALVALYNSCGGDNWTTKTNWLTGNVEDWYGITVAENQVTSLNLNYNNLSGIIPIEIGNLTNLTELNLYINSLEGEIPIEIGNLTNLTSLGLYGNQLTGEIPSELGNLTNLTFLILSGNQLTGEIPAELGNLTNLTGLRLHNNSLEGEIPIEIGNLTNLTSLRLFGNQLTGEIPTAIGNLTNLHYLDLYYNQLTGEIPIEIGNLTNLITLRLSGNQLTGEIPIEIGNLTKLNYLYLYDNQLTGEIPTAIGNLTNLTFLWLSHNSLEGEIPMEMGNLINLESLYLSNNNLSGMSDLSALTKISANSVYTTLNISSNSFTFEDLESTKLNLEGKIYAPQDTLALTVGNVRINESSAFSFADYLVEKNSLISNNSQYSIFKDGQLVYGPLNNFDLSIASLNLEDEGKYNMEITNSTFPELKLISDTLQLEVNTKPNKPTLLLPENGETDVVLEPTLTWSCTDRDGDTAFKYSVFFDNGNGLEKISETNNSYYNFSSSDIKLKYLKTYSWAIVANDGVLDSEQSEVWPFTIKEESFAPTDIELSENSIDENKNIGFIVGVFSTTDSNENDEHVYSFMEANNFFEIKGNQLIVKSTLDYETNYEHLIKIRSTDKEGLYIEKDFVIHIEDIFENTTGIEDLESNGLNLYPNPVKNYLTVSSSETNTVLIQVLGVGGEVVFSEEWESPFTNRINFTNYSNGLYLVRFIIDGKVVTHKIMLVK